MILRKCLPALIFMVVSFTQLHAQNDFLLAQNDFCDAVNAILRDAPNRFKNIRGKVINGNINAQIWESGIKIPGTIASRFVSSMGLFYEGALFQTWDTTEIHPVFEKYKNILDSCLTKQDYTLMQQENAYPGSYHFKKVLFMKDIKDPDIQVPPPHVTLDVVYTKELGKYTVVMYIYEH